jgi:hypothetical protein
MRDDDSATSASTNFAPQLLNRYLLKDAFPAAFADIGRAPFGAGVGH